MDCLEVLWCCGYVVDYQELMRSQQGVATAITIIIIHIFLHKGSGLDWPGKGLAGDSIWKNPPSNIRSASWPEASAANPSFVLFFMAAFTDARRFLAALLLADPPAALAVLWRMGFFWKSKDTLSKLIITCLQKLRAQGMQPHLARDPACIMQTRLLHSIREGMIEPTPMTS